MSRLGGAGSVNSVASKTGLKRQAVFRLVISFLNSGNGISENIGKEVYMPQMGPVNLPPQPPTSPQNSLAPMSQQTKG